MAEQYTNIGVADIGTQLFWFNPNEYTEYNVADAAAFALVKDRLYTKSGTTYTKVADSATYSSGTTYYVLGRFEYAVPVTAGAEFGGDTESFEASETDLDYVPKIGGRTTLNDITYTVNYTSTKYRRIEEISDNTEENIYVEVLSDGGAMVFAGTSGMPSLTAGDVRQINWTIVPSVVVFCDKIDNMDDKAKERIASIAPNKTLIDGNALLIDISTIPSIRQDYYATKNLGE